MIPSIVADWYESISGAVTHYLLGAVQALQSVLALFWPFRATFLIRHFSSQIAVPRLRRK